MKQPVNIILCILVVVVISAVLVWALKRKRTTPIKNNIEKNDKMSGSEETEEIEIDFEFTKIVKWHLKHKTETKVVP